MIVTENKNIEFSVISEPNQAAIFPSPLSERISSFPRIRFMGSKHRLLPWIMQILSGYQFKSVLDAFSGSSVVGYTFKCKKKQVFAADFLNFSYRLAHAIIENSKEKILDSDIDILFSKNKQKKSFIKNTFSGIFYTLEELEFLDHILSNIYKLENEYKTSLAMAALFRSCIKKQPRGVFTIANGGKNYDDGRRDLKLSLKEHFRGRALENFTEKIISEIFGQNYNVRSSFIGKDGQSTAKSDFAIPSKDNPFILIESKAYGATGSKQTDAVGDAVSIISQKRHDTIFLMITDGVSWHARKSDFYKLIKLQNEGAIYRIYTQKMKNELIKDLQQLKYEFGI